MATKTIDWRKLDDGGLEGGNVEFDFVLTDDKGTVILDVFDATNDDADEAHLESLQFDSVEEAREAAQSYGE
jgi:hypothetical protein